MDHAYFRIGRIIYRAGRSRRVRVGTCRTATDAALAVRALRLGRDWRRYI